MEYLQTKEENNFDPQYLRNKKQIKVLRNEVKMKDSFIRILTGICLTLVVLTSILLFETNRLSNISDEYKHLSEDFDELSSLLQETSKTVEELDKQNQELIIENNSLNESLDILYEREELFNKYDYALFREDGSRTDLTYEDIKLVENLTKEKGMKEDTIDLILSLVMTESNGFEHAENGNSTAIGYGQFLSDTGNFVYTKLMRNDNYNHNYAKDGSINLEMMVNYIDHLNNIHNGDIDSIINNYRGLDDQNYKNKLNTYLACAGKSLDTIKIK